MKEQLSALLIVLAVGPDVARAEPPQHVWSRGYGGIGSDWGRSVSAVGDGGALVTGHFSGTADFGGGPLISSGGSDIFVLKLDSRGHPAWSRGYGDASSDQGLSVSATPDGGALVTGSFNGTVDFGGGSLTSAANGDIFVLKLDSSGNHAWSRAYGGALGSNGRSVSATADGGALVTGAFRGTIDFGGGPLTNDGASTDVFVLKLDSSGIHVWSRAYPDSAGSGGLCVSATAGSGAILTGNFRGTIDFGGGTLTEVTEGASRPGDTFVVKLDSSGNHVWSRRYGSVGIDSGWSVAATADGGAIVTGNFWYTVDFGAGPVSSAGAGDTFVIRLDSNGDHVWSRRYGNQHDDVAQCVAATSDGGAIFTGGFEGTIDFGGGPLVNGTSFRDDIFLFKLNCSGNHVWSTRYGSNGEDRGYGVAATANGALVTGLFQNTVDFGGGPLTSSGSQDIVVLKVMSDRDGDGLLDEWEVAGVDVNCDGIVDLDLPSLGADSLHKDLFVEIDAMEGLAPVDSALRAVVGAFAAVPNALLTPPNPDGRDGISLHIIGNGGAQPAIDDAHISSAAWSADGWHEFEAVKAQYFGTANERASPDSATILEAKAKVFRYCVFAQSLGTSGVSGQAEYPCGNDFMLTLGSPWQPVGGSAEQQAGTLMHELGHTLGLKHGGSDDKLFKPNYYSVMNYTWQFPIAVPVERQDLEKYRNSWRLDYARYAFNALNENNLDERIGLQGGAQIWVPAGPLARPKSSRIAPDPPLTLPSGRGEKTRPTGTALLPQLVRSGMPCDWNRDRSIEPSVAADVSYVDASTEGPTPGESLVAPLDWPRISYLPNGERTWTDPTYHNPWGLRGAPSSEEMTWDIFQRLSNLHFDCNGNGVADDAEIDAGTLADQNADGIPDICEGEPVVAPEVSAAQADGQTLYAESPGLNGSNLRWRLNAEARTTLSVYDISGRLVARVVDRILPAGDHRTRWDGKDGQGSRVAAGVYLVRLTTTDFVKTAKVTLLR